jgi:type VI secretion system protein ImpG
MNPRLLHLYNQELRHLREMGSEFAEEFPKIASRLSMEGLEVADPYVERLLEGAAFLAARVQLKLEAEFPRFTHHLLEMVHPHFLSPTPAMAIAQFQPILSDANLAEGFVIKRGECAAHRFGGA